MSVLVNAKDLRYSVSYIYDLFFEVLHNAKIHIFLQIHASRKEYLCFFTACLTFKCLVQEIGCVITINLRNTTFFNKTYCTDKKNVKVCASVYLELDVPLQRGTDERFP